jgi:hypothetical protein
MIIGLIKNVKAAHLVMTHLRSVFISRLLLLPTIQGYSEGLLMQAGVGLTDAVSPPYMKKYWLYGVNFNIAFGAAVNEKWSFNLAYTHHTFDYRNGIAITGDNACANQAMIHLKRYAPTRLQRLAPFISVGAGFSLLKAPAVYRKVERVPLLILPENKLEDAWKSSAPVAEVSLGVDYQLSPLSALFTELFSSIAFSPQQNYVGWGLRMGVMFTI